ncbi:hypothetical protein IFR05_012280 [Cadophora sp. M221]|nr:hypothetical protein IFR05_012280 [Cadophora sp. M221]
MSQSSQPSQPQEEEEHEISALEFARRNGLSQNHLASYIGYRELETLLSRHADNADNVDAETNLPEFDFGPELKVEERLSCSKEAASILSRVKRDESSDEITGLVASLLKDNNSNRKKKLELPLLRTDVDNDCRKFASRQEFDIDLRDIKLPLEAVAEGEGFDWTKQYENLGAEILQDLKAEKIGVTRHAMAFLQSCINIAWTEEEQNQLWAREQAYKRRTTLEPITPPLSPLPEQSQPFEPSSSDPAFQIPILSDPLSPTKQDLEAIEEDIFGQDIPTPLRSLAKEVMYDGFSEDMAALGELFPSLIASEQTPSPESRPAKWEDFKVEVPLMPNELTTTSKTVRFSDEVQEQYYQVVSSPITLENESEIFRETFGQAHSNANQKAEQEKLSSEDTTARVDVPELNFDKPDAPWKPFEEAQSKLALSSLQKAFFVETIGWSLPYWPGSRQLEIKLPWAPFPANLGKLAVEECSQGDDTTWEHFVEDDGDIIDSSGTKWKAAGLKILKDEEDGEDIDFGQFPKDRPLDLPSIAKKRKMELEERGNSMHIGPAAAAVSMTSTSLVRKTAKLAPPVGDIADGDIGLLGGAFSAQASLDNYLELQGKKRTKLAESSYFTKPTETHPARVKSGNNAPKLADLPIRRSPANRELVPVPDIRPLTKPTWIVVSTNLLKNRALIKRIEAQLPSVELIERDFTAHNTSAWLPGSVTRSPVKSPLDAEADFIISPSVGIIITTMQKMKQKSLPGDKTKPAIRERLEKVSLRYEKLLVLISTGFADDIPVGLFENDCLAFAEFAGFLAGLDASISMQFVGGGEEALSKWIVSSIVQYRVDTDLLSDETFWELFLRRAGLNAFAAQAVIAAVKAPDGVNAGSLSKASLFGLTAFVEMGTEDRIAHFSHICGHRVLARVSAVIDARWE